MGEMHMNRKKGAALALGLACSIIATTAFGDSGCGESVLLLKRNELRESAARYSTVRQNAELRGLATFSLERLIEVSDKSEVSMSGKLNATPINPNRSLFIRDFSLLKAFSFAELMEVLATGTEASAPAGLNLFKDWWRTAAPPKSGQDPAIGCTDKLINGLDYMCPKEGGLATLADVTSLEDIGGNGPPFRILALVNRGDLWNFETDSADCGEFRVVVGVDNKPARYKSFEEGEYLFNFEAVLRRGENGPGFCKAVQKLWASFSVNGDDRDVAGQLRRFYLEENGLTPDGRLVAPSTAGAEFTFGPIIAPANFGLDGEAPEEGQIRTNAKFKMTGDHWDLREYRFRRLPGTGLRILPVGLAATPPKAAGKPDHPLNETLAEALALNTAGIDTTQFDDVKFQPADRCLEAAESVADDYSIRSILQPYFRNNINNKAVAVLKAMPNSNMGIYKRSYNLEFTTCIGCHNTIDMDNLKHLTAPYGGFSKPEALAKAWKSTMNFHFAQFDEEPQPNPVRYKLQHQLAKVFLPKREYLMRTVIDSRPPRFCSELSKMSRTAFPDCSGPDGMTGTFFP
jgi:hypothetical protein